MACLDEETLLGFVDGRLDDPTRQRVEQHIDICAGCRKLVAQLAGEAAEPPSTARTRRLRVAGSTPTATSVRDTQPVHVAQRRSEHSFDLNPGTLVDDNYLVRSPIGRGGMGTVYLATDQRLDRPVALKLINPEILQSPGMSQRFVFEARVTARFSHPNIIAVYGAGEIDGRPYLVLEYVRGQTLRQLLVHHATFPREEVVSIAVALARALSEAHRHGVLHRDLKPANVMVTDDGRVQVLDFGLARLLDERPPETEQAPSDNAPEALSTRSGLLEKHYNHTRACGIRGTPNYMAPEQWRADVVTGAVDIWALGVMLFELTFGRHPFKHRQLDALRDHITSIGSVDVPPVASPHGDLRTLIRACLRPRPEDRLTAPQVVEQLERLQVSVQASEHPLRRWWIATVLVAAIAVALSLAVLTLKRPSNGPMTQQQTPQASMARVLQPKRVGASAEIADRTRQPPAAESLHRQSRRQRVRNQRKRIRAQHARKAYGRLNIQATDGSEPRAVIVVLDGQVVGETPLQLNRIKVGKHFVTVRRDGYGVKRRVVRIDRGQTKTLLFELQRLDRRPEDRSPQ